MNTSPCRTSRNRASRRSRVLALAVILGQLGFGGGVAIAATPPQALGAALTSAEQPKGEFYRVWAAVGGVPNVGATLTAYAQSNPNGAEFTYKWFRDDKLINGATKDTYIVKAADKGHRIKVKVTAHKAGYAPETGTSVATNLVKAAGGRAVLWGQGEVSALIDDNHYLTAIYPVVTGIGNDKRSAELNQEFSDFTSQLNAIKAAYRAWEKEGLDDPAWSYAEYHELSYQLLKQTSEEATFQFDSYWYGGGAHGLQGSTIETFNLETGKLKTLSDYFPNTNDYKARIMAKLKVWATQHEFDVSDLDLKDVEFYVKDGKLHLIFQPYQIGPYAAGMPEFVTSMSALKS